MIVYISGPYSAATEGGRLDNTLAALRAGKSVLEAGHFPFIPHLTHFFDQIAWDCPPTYEEYMQWDDAFLARCDAILFLGHSPGADRELARAQELGLPVYYDTDDLPVVEGHG